VDGATSFKADSVSDACWMGKIDRKNPLKISWTKLPPHPGKAGFRIAAGASDRDDKIYFLGGTAVPTNYRSEGPDGKLAEPSAMSFAFNLKTKTWEVVNPEIPHPPMDNHVLVATEQGLVIIGGTDADGKVSKAMRIISKQKTAH
jgi:N-acetylneuraminic acid mutarotase